MIEEAAQVDLLDQDSSVLGAAMQGVSAAGISVGTTTFPTAKWKGGNTPKAVSVGRLSYSQSFRVLYAKHAGEKAVARAASSGGFGYVVVRPGRLVEGPFANLDVAK